MTAKNPETVVCQNCRAEFTIEAEDFTFYEKVQVPPPTFCPSCRFQRRLAWRSEKSLYRRNCDKCGKSIISVFPKESGLVVYCNPCWWSDNWSGLDYGVDFDQKKPFLIQVRELLQKAPVMALFGIYTTLENSEYTNMVGHLKNCYLITHSDFDENCMYGSIVDFCKDSMDNLMLAESELCYETVDCRKCYKTFYSVDCESCNNIYFSKNCVGCSDCVGCVNLKNKKYCIFNKEYSKTDYEKLVKDYKPNSTFKIEGIKIRAREFWKKFPQKYMHERHNSDVSGDYIYKSKNTKNTFIATDTEDSKFCAYITPPKVSNCYDFTHYGDVADLVYDSLQAGNQVSNILFSWFSVTSERNIEYSIFTIGSQNLFGCVSLKKKEYCILNKQYSKEDYETLRRQIIKQMETIPYKDKKDNRYSYGEFFPIEMSPFGYNATTAQEVFPMRGTEAKTLGYRWTRTEKSVYKTTLTSEQVPDSSANLTDSVLHEVIECEHKGECDEQCSSAFKIIPQELQFYKKMNLPLPKLCSNCRHYERLTQRNPLKLWRRKCTCSGTKSQNDIYQNTVIHFHGEQVCPNEFETSYAPDRSEIVYCEQCYNAEVV